MPYNTPRPNEKKKQNLFDIDQNEFDEAMEWAPTHDKDPYLEAKIKNPGVFQSSPNSLLGNTWRDAVQTGKNIDAGMNNAMTAVTNIAGGAVGALKGIWQHRMPKRDSFGFEIPDSNRGLEDINKSISQGRDDYTIPPDEDSWSYDEQIRNLETAGNAVENISEKLLPYREGFERTAVEMGIPVEVAAAIWTT